MSEVTKEQQEEAIRLKQYKNVAKHEDMRRRRTECSVELRKHKRDELMMKRRNLQEEEADEENGTAGFHGELAEGTNSNNKCSTRLSFNEVIAVLLANPTLQQMRDCFEAVRRQLSRSKSPPVDEVIANGLLNALVQALSVEDDKVRFECAWALTNIVSGTSEQTQKAVEAGATQPLIALTQSKDLALAEQSLWAVANIAGESAQLRDYVINWQGVEAMMLLLEKVDSLNEGFVRTLAWAFSNMCRHKHPHAPIRVLEVLARGLGKLIQHPDKLVRQDACWAISYLTDGPDEQMMLAVDGGLLPVVASFLKDGDHLIAPALRVLGNMATGNDVLTQKVIELGTLDEVASIVQRAKSNSIVKECCWLVSNILAEAGDRKAQGNRKTSRVSQQETEESQQETEISVLAGDHKCQYEASWALANLASGGTSAQLMHLINIGGLAHLCRLLTQKNNDIVTNTLETLTALLHMVSTHYPDRMDSVREEIEGAGGLEELEKLQESNNDRVYELAYNLVSTYLGEDSEEVDATDENVISNGGTLYNF